MAYPILPFLFRPYLVRELPGWGKLYRILRTRVVDEKDQRWAEAPVRVIRGKRHGYRLALDLRDNIERGVFFLGRNYDLEIQLLLDSLLSSGDTFVDVGANIGLTTLYAARLVGPKGRVIAFEPQPECVAHLEKTLLDNDIRHVTVQSVGLSDREGILVLKVLGSGTIMASFASDPEHDDPLVRNEFPAPVRIGDPLVADRIVGNLVIKIDVEGFEVYVIRGLRDTINRFRPPILAEVEERYLRRAGTDKNELFAFFRERSYRPFLVTLERRLMIRDRFRLRSIDECSELPIESNVLWLPHEKLIAQCPKTPPVSRWRRRCLVRPRR